MILQSRRIKIRLAVLCAAVAVAAAALGYALPVGWAGIGLAWAGVGLAVVAAGGGLLGGLLAGRTLRPIQEITASACRLEQASKAQRQFFADAVEEMKASMEVQRDLLRAAISPDGTPPELDQVGALLEVTERQERLVEKLLTLARSQQAVIERVPVELADIAFRVSDGLEPEARRAGIEMRVAARPARTPGDPVLLERLAENLLRNAVRYNTTDGWVRVVTGTDGKTVHLTVANTGPVVPTGQVHTLFEPFRHRVDHDPAGLGLLIVRSVAHAHGGEVNAAARDGGGLVVQVTLPAH